MYGYLYNICMLALLKQVGIETFFEFTCQVMRIQRWYTFICISAVVCGTLKLLHCIVLYCIVLMVYLSHIKRIDNNLLSYITKLT